MKKAITILTAVIALFTLCSGARAAEVDRTSIKAMGDEICRISMQKDAKAIVALSHPDALKDVKASMAQDGYAEDVLLSSLETNLKAEPAVTSCEVTEIEESACEEDVEGYYSLLTEEDTLLFKFDKCGLISLSEKIEGEDEPEDVFVFVFKVKDKWYLDILFYDFMPYEEDTETEENAE